MPIRLAANLSTMFQELPFLERFAAASRAGFKAVEFVSPYAEAEADVAKAAADAGLTVALFNIPPGDWAAGERGYAANPSRRKEARVGAELALRYAKTLGCSTLHLMAGKIPADADRRLWKDALIENARFAADLTAEHGITIVLEAINTKVDIPGYFYDQTDDVLEILDLADRPNLKLMYDAYHMQIMEGDLANTFLRILPRVGHVQIAGVPGRKEPANGEVNWPWLLGFMVDAGYEGWIGCEYFPKAGTLAGLGWAGPFLASAF
jgi:hydroxypyruvate isomerase